ncbi:MAG TPA: AgmX/PglI C-terminal domain-containing protein [Polyangiaceae bacterium]|jgi:hypothetical protein
MASLHPELHSIHPHRALPLSFVAQAEPEPRAEPDAPTHLLLKRAPLAAGEFERPELSALEVMGLWGSTILFATHLSPLRSFKIGESSKHAPVDFEISSRDLGGEHFELIEPRNGVAQVNVPHGARCLVKQSDAPAFAPSDATSIALLPGSIVELALGRLKFRVANVAAGQATPRAGLRSAESSVLAAFGASFGIAAALLAAFAFWLPALDATDDEELDHDRLVMMQQYLSANAERSREETPNNSESGQKDAERGAPAEAAQGRMGTLGKPNMQTTNHRAAVAGDSSLTELSRARAIEDARHFGMIELLGTLSSAGGESSPFARAPAIGSASTDAEGNMWGDTIGESGGNGLGLSGPDNGGGGHGDTVGMGGIGTCGTGNCGPSGWGHGNHLGSGEHKTAVPHLGRGGEVITSGRLPPEVVQRIVRQNYGRFRMCYERGLGSNPNLSGRVTARFVIGREGAVASVQNGGSDLPDASVVSCVVQAFYGLSFPTPENGIVTVSYPIMFSPG